MGGGGRGGRFHLVINDLHTYLLPILKCFQYRSILLLFFKEFRPEIDRVKLHWLKVEVAKVDKPARLTITWYLDFLLIIFNSTKMTTQRLTWGVNPMVKSWSAIKSYIMTYVYNIFEVTMVMSVKWEVALGQLWGIQSHNWKTHLPYHQSVTYWYREFSFFWWYWKYLILTTGRRTCLITANDILVTLFVVFVLCICIKHHNRHH